MAVRIAEEYRDRHGAARRARSSHVDRGRPPPRPRAGSGGGVRRPDLPKNQRQGGAAARHRGHHHFQRGKAATGIRRVFAHSSYLINLASPDPVAGTCRRRVHRRVQRARRSAFRAWSSIPARTWAPGAPGSDASSPPSTRRSRGRQDSHQGRAREHRGGGNSLGRTFELAELIDGAARPERIGVCIDTCHLFAGGYDRTHAGYGAPWRSARPPSGVGGARVSPERHEGAFGSGLDRHEHIGRGFLGVGPFGSS